MSEYRRDRTTGEWVLVAPERKRRPHVRFSGHASTGDGRALDPECPFCPGNENMLTDILLESPLDGSLGWRTRVVANKYPMVSSGASKAPAFEGAPDRIAGGGYHEVIIETARHNADLSALAVEEVEDVIRTYLRRYADLMKRPNVKAVIVFRNHGRRAGASLGHPHSQIVATGMVPPRLSASAAWARRHYENHRQCVVCEEVQRELESGLRVVEETDNFLIVVPFAAAGPFEQRIYPRRHQACFSELAELEIRELAGALKRALQHLNAVLDDPPYNFVIESGTADSAGSRYRHWDIRIVPAIQHLGGFELGAGLPVNSSCPEDDAEELRSVRF
ncbi:galactose-1-phosphate uridylyltransferase [Hyphococcus luteus]|uniref:galactose-1-phosphate uridylyltransferase n=1 Tax=Hyphococcus luteus TaxID=2058213 RepID=UPI0013FD5792|nr:galactose-1-phosphate uridylyltransferase [Marinicaulis flavus]